MQTKSIAAGALIVAALFLTGCQDQQPPTVAPPNETVAVNEVPMATPAAIETPPVATTTEVAAAPDMTTAERVPSVLRRTPSSEPTPPPAQQVTATFPPRVTVSDLKEMMDEGTAVVVDVRDRVSFASEHIPGSINIPVQETTSRIGELPRDKMIVTYCA